MEEHAWLNPVAMVWAIAVVMLGSFGVYWLAKGRKGLGAGMLAAGVLLVVVTIGSTAWWDSWGGKEHSMSVQGFSATTDPLFTVKIIHDAYTTNDRVHRFGNAGDVQRVVEVFQTQHPDGVPTTPATFPGDEDVSVWHQSMGNMRFDLYRLQDGGGFELVSGVARVVGPDGVDTGASVPFPDGGSQVALGEPRYTPKTWDQWRDYYDGMAEVTVGNGTITLPMDTGGTVTLTFDETRDSYIAKVDD